MRIAATQGRVLVGVGGWNFAPWRGAFYPRGLPHARELAYMSSRLDSIEVNSTFYRTQTPATFQRWHDETPASFVFSVKAPMYASNRRDLATAGHGIARFLDSGLLRLGSKLGPINWQLGPTKQFSAAEMEAFLELLPARHENRRLRHAIEVRHHSFAVPQFVRLAKRYGVAIVIAGDSQYPRIPDRTASFAYLRIMGTTAPRALGYAPAALTRWAKRARALASGGDAGLKCVIANSTPKTKAGDVFLYVISGAKERNPAAAAALIQRLR